MNDDPNATPSGSLINLNDDDDGDSTKVSLQQEQIDYLSAGFSGPAVLEISGSGSHISDLKSPHNRVPRSRTSSVSSQASDSYFVSPPAFPSRQLPLPSDVESITSEAEDAGVSLDLISKEELYRCYCRMQQRSTKYRWKFSQVRIFFVVCLNVGCYKCLLTFTPPDSFPSSQFWGIYALIGGVRVMMLAWVLAKCSGELTIYLLLIQIALSSPLVNVILLLNICLLICFN